MDLPIRFAPLLIALATLVAAPATQAIPVNVGDPTLRAISIDVESSSCDPVAGVANHAAERANCVTFASDPGAVFGATLDGTFSVGGTTATVTVDALDWEQILFANQGMSVAGSVGIVPGTTSDATLTFDTVTGDVLTWDWTSQIIVIIFGQLALTGSLGAEPNDVYFRNVFGNFVSLNCNAAPGVIAVAPVSPECNPAFFTPVNHIPYDPLTGTITALADVITGPPQLIRAAWAPTDWRLNEIPEPGVSLLLGSFGVSLAWLRSPRRS